MDVKHELYRRVHSLAALFHSSYCGTVCYVLAQLPSSKTVLAVQYR